MEKFKLLRPRKDFSWQEPTNRKRELINKEKPDLLREMFSFTEVPKITFDDVAVKPNPPEEIFMTDTTFRDGQQARPPYTVEQIVDLFDFLHRLSGNKGVIRQSEFFLYSEKDREAVKKCMDKGYKFPEITSWIRANEKDLELVKQMNIKETGMLASSSDYHIFYKFGLDRKQVAEKFLNVVRKSIEYEIKPRVHLEDLTRANIYEFIIPFAQKLMTLQEETGMPIKIRLCDTMGFGIDDPYASLPRGVPKLVQAFTKEAGVPKEQLEWHGHNDFMRVHSNAVAAWLYGCAAANGTLLGFGERTGNPPLEALCMEYAGLTGSANGMDLTTITDIANYFRQEIHQFVPPDKPFVGEAFNSTRAGIHADGLIKNPEIYNIFDTEKILKRPVQVSVTDKSGLAGIALWVDNCLGMKGDKKLDKNHPGLKKMEEAVMKQFQEGRTTAISPQEMLQLCNKYLPELCKGKKTCLIW